MKFKSATLLIAFAFCTSTFAVNPDQATITALQKQIATVQTEMKTAIATQQATTQKAISDMHTQIQTQIAQLQKEMQQLQAQLTSEIKMVQEQAMKTKRSEAPVVTATPGVTQPAEPAK